MLHQTTADVADLTFHVCSSVFAVLPASVVAVGQILGKHLVDNWDALPAVLKEHSRNELFKNLTPTGVTCLARLRCFYILSLVHQSLEGRCGAISDKLLTLIQTHIGVFAQLDAMCSPFDLGSLASGYASGLTELIRKGNVTIDELTEDAPSAVQPAQESSTPAVAADSAAVASSSASGNDGTRMVSYRELSVLATDHAKKGEGIAGTSGILFATEAVQEFCLLLAADLMMQCRSPCLVGP